MAHHRIRLIAAEKVDSHDYGIVYKSETGHDFTGPNIHNRHHRHVLQVWLNSVKPDALTLTDPNGQPTTHELSFLWAAQASVISAHPGLRDETPRGATLHLRDTVELFTSFFPGSPRSLGLFRIEARPLHNPHLVRIFHNECRHCEDFDACELGDTCPVDAEATAIAAQIGGN